MTVPGLRERNRRDVTAAVLDAARRQLAEVGAAALSLRGVAREVGMVPSALYRYFPSRDHLITALLLDGYGGLADAVEAGDARARRSDLAGRWRGACHAARDWAREHPHEWSLLYGSPVPGYGAPADTIAPVLRITGVFGRLLRDVGPPAVPVVRRLPPALRQDLRRLKESEVFGAPGSGRPELDDVTVLRGLGAWVQVFGLISFELFGQFANTIDDLDGFFAAEVDLLFRGLQAGAAGT